MSIEEIGDASVEATDDRAAPSPDGAPSRREVAESRAYDFDESVPRFRVVVGSEERPTGFVIRAEDENEARRQLMVAAIRLGFDRTGEDLRLRRVDEGGATPDR